MHQGRRLQRLTGRFTRDSLLGELAQFFVDDGQQRLGRRGVAVLDGVQNA